MNKRLAYFDSFAGLVPCVVQAVHDDGCVTIRMTATRGGWERGTIVGMPGRHVIPRENVIRKRSMSGARIVGGWDWAKRFNS